MQYLLETKQASKIQKTFRGYLSRKKMKNLYINLPDDIQKHIIFFVRQPYYYSRFKTKINTIIELKIRLYLDVCEMVLSDGYLNCINYLLENKNEIINTYRVFTKYCCIINENKKKNLTCALSSNLSKIIHLREVYKKFTLYNETLTFYNETTYQELNDLTTILFNEYFKFKS